MRGKWCVSGKNASLFFGVLNGTLGTTVTDLTRAHFASRTSDAKFWRKPKVPKKPSLVKEVINAAKGTTYVTLQIFLEGFRSEISAAQVAQFSASVHDHVLRSMDVNKNITKKVELNVEFFRNTKSLEHEMIMRSSFELKPNHKK